MRMHTLDRGTVLAVCASLRLLAQTGQITGLITDPSTTPIPGANVVITNVETVIRHEALSNEHGYYTVLFLNPGDYKIRTSDRRGG
jgi:hypothetical protein